MWLHKAMPVISSLGVRSYYRVTVAGARLPETGPVLLVANHNNSLVDPALAVVAAGRTVRFLTKAPLFDDKLIGWLIAAVGSVPVYRQQDDPTKLSQNLDSFRDVHAALAAGDVVGIFPEGITHSASRLAPLKTGAARIAIGAAGILGRDFPIVAMGLVFRDRDRFRSEAHVIISEPLRWGDLVGEGESKRAVRELTARIEAQMRSVTLNLERWEDEPLVRAAEQVWRAELDGDAALPRDAAAKLDRLRRVTDALAALREGTDDSWRETAIALRAHARQLHLLGLTPAELRADVKLGETIEWTVSHVPLVLVLPVSLIGGIVFWPAKWVTTTIADRLTAAEGPESLVTHRVLVGAVVFLLWFLIVALVVWAAAGAWWALVALLLQPFLAFAALAVGDRRARAWAAVRRFFLRRAEKPRLDALRERQRVIAERLRQLI
ncbi:MAG: 1-acyl-sn-glycerol-3-phosphate acyltransferase [Gemmatimonadales bacterium]|nr:1-acyl-sn-glycerol-3-phosphate acyltransferase [Gemmatimonadota bacterium]MCL4213298.1 1-acyl-sn-glycerol-3-phosphate acyltransferase [Gemmatimonadales bacterium]